MMGVPSSSGFAAYSVQTSSGPHITMQAGVVCAGRFWTTTASDSLKARSVRKHHWAAAVLPGADGTTDVIAGPTEALEPGKLFASSRDPFAAWLAAPAVLGIAGSQLRQLVGYLEAASQIPGNWLPHRRVLLATRIDHSMTLRGDQLHRSLGLDRPAVLPEPSGGLPSSLREGVPATHRILLDQRSTHLAFETARGPIVLPAERREDDSFGVSLHALSAIVADLPGRAAAVFDESSDPRPDRKRGVLLRGDVALTGFDGAQAIVSLTTDRVTTWDGFRARTRSVRQRMAAA